MRLKYFRQIFGKYSNIKFNENPQVRSELFQADGRTNKQIKNSLL